MTPPNSCFDDPPLRNCLIFLIRFKQRVVVDRQGRAIEPRRTPWTGPAAGEQENLRAAGALPFGQDGDLIGFNVTQASTKMIL